MKIPTLKEVKEYFKDAKEVESCFLEKLKFKGVQYGHVENTFMNKGNNNATLWNKDKGYAKIISYKEKPIKITNKFIKENADKTFKEVFPNVFKEELVIGEWYKVDNGCMFNYQKKIVILIMDMDSLVVKYIMKILKNIFIIKQYQPQNKKCLKL